MSREEQGMDFNGVSAPVCTTPGCEHNRPRCELFEDLNKRYEMDLGKHCRGYTPAGYPIGGFVYWNDLWIEDTRTWSHDDGGGRWYLLLNRDEWRSDDLAELEARLYEWALDEGYWEEGVARPAQPEAREEQGMSRKQFGPWSETPATLHGCVVYWDEEATGWYLFGIEGGEACPTLAQAREQIEEGAVTAPHIYRELRPEGAIYCVPEGQMIWEYETWSEAYKALGHVIGNLWGEAAPVAAKPEPEPERRDVYRCESCGGEDIEVSLAAWFLPNSEWEYVETDSEGGPLSVFCPNCDTTVRAIADDGSELVGRWD